MRHHRNAPPRQNRLQACVQLERVITRGSGSVTVLTLGIGVRGYSGLLINPLEFPVERGWDQSGAEVLIGGMGHLDY